MADFWLYFKMGLDHVLDWQAYDHILFLIVLAAAYTFNQWKRLLILVTLFVVGHTLSLLLAVYGVVKVNSAWVEFLIPATIILTALFNIFTAGKEKRREKLGLMYAFTLFFGLIHGLGFASYFNLIVPDNKLLPLLEFALGIEAAQIIVVIVVLILAFLLQTVFRFNKRDWILVVSSIVLGLAIPMLMENWIF